MAVDTFFVGVLKGVGKIYLQTVIDCHSRYAWPRLYPSKLPVTAVHVMNNDAIPTFEAHGARIETFFPTTAASSAAGQTSILTNSSCNSKEIEHRTTPVKRPQSNGIVERLHRTLLDGHFRVEGRRTWFETIEDMQKVLDAYLVVYNTKRPHQGRGVNGRTPQTAFVQGLPKPTVKKEE